MDGRRAGWRRCPLPRGAAKWPARGRDRRRAPGTPASNAWKTYIACDDADAAAERVRSAGGTVVADATDLPGVARLASCLDPAGAAFGLWEARAIGGAEVVNTPGSWNFSELNTADPGGARRFYGDVFGWEVDEVDIGGGPSRMVRLPGYADFLERYDPGIRQRHADFGAPPGFSECIAWILPLDDGTLPHWSVTFTVADADAIANRARELGGTIETEPVDIGPVRSAQLRDPHGCALCGERLQPGLALSSALRTESGVPRRRAARRRRRPRQPSAFRPPRDR